MASNPNETKIKLPNRNEIAQLPQWARVVYAVRSARRVQPLFVKAWPAAPKKHVDVMKRALNAAERSARRGRPDLRTDSLFVALEDVADDAVDAHGVLREPGTAYNYAAAAVYSVAAAAYSVEGSADNAAEAVADAVKAAAYTNARSLIISLARADFEQLRKLSNVEGWTDESPVLMEFLEPLWPERRPEWFPTPVLPSQSSATFGPVNNDGPDLRFSIAPGRASKIQVQAVLRALNEYHIASGGLGLEFRIDGLMIRVRQGVPA